MRHSIQRLINEIKDEASYIRSLTGISAPDQTILDTISTVPRERFVTSGLKSIAYQNTPLPIGHGQTISQPYIVALMTHLLQLKDTDKVLEIGTGSGYQAAVLSRLCKEVFSIEIIDALRNQAAHRFKKLHYDNIHCRTSNGYFGWPEKAPFDGIIVTASCTHIPSRLVTQLKSGARLVIPIGLEHCTQELFIIEKKDDESTVVSSILPVAFVPLINDPELIDRSLMH